MNQDGEKTVIVVNRNAGSGRAGRYWDYMCREPYLKGKLIDATSPQAMSDGLNEVLGKKTKRIIALGGDGTFHYVVNEIMDRKLERQVEIGLLPLGTGSDLVRSLGVPTKPAKALKLLDEGSPIPMDVFRVDLGDRIRYSINVASLGFSSEVAIRVNRKKRRYLWTYLLSAFMGILHYKPVSLKLLCSGESWFSGTPLLVAAANGKYFGRGICIAPGAKQDNGLIYCVVVTTSRLFRLLAMIPKLYLGRHLQSRYVRITQARNVEVVDLHSTQLTAELDGEIYTGSQFKVRVIPSAIRIIR